MSGEANPTTEAATTPTEAKASISRIEELEGPGELSEPAFAALFGVNSDDNENGDWSKAVSIPINSPNVVLGRDHNKITEKNFVSLGKNTSLSRYHVRIFCRDIRGGRLDIDGNTGKWKYNDEDASSSRSATKVPVGADDQEEYFQGGACGSFAIEVVGKNPITVNRRPLHRGQVALLKHRTPLQIAVWSLYFLLPDPCSEDAGQQKDNTINAPNPALESFKKKRKMGEVNTTSGAEIKRKKLLSTASVGSNFGHVSTASGVRLAYSVELESMSLDELLDRMTEAIFNNQWSRKEQMIGTTICLRAVQQAAASPEIQEIARREGGVNRMDVIKWIENNPKYHKWRKQMLSKMEVKSYESNIGKTLVKAGYIKTGSAGRLIRWILPEVDVSVDNEEEESSQAEREKAKTELKSEVEEEVKKPKDDDSIGSESLEKELEEKGADEPDNDNIDDI